MSLLVVFEVLGLLVKLITGQAKYSRLKMGNLTEPIQMHLS